MLELLGAKKKKPRIFRLNWIYVVLLYMTHIVPSKSKAYGRSAKPYTRFSERNVRKVFSAPQRAPKHYIQYNVLHNAVLLLLLLLFFAYINSVVQYSVFGWYIYTPNTVLWYRIIRVFLNSFFTSLHFASVFFFFFFPVVFFVLSVLAVLFVSIGPMFHTQCVCMVQKRFSLLYPWLCYVFLSNSGWYGCGVCINRAGCL